MMRRCGGGWAVGALCAGWYVASAASNVAGKLVLTALARPLTVTVVQLAATALLCGPALWLLGARGAAWPRGLLRVLLPLALAKALTTACSQLSLWKVPVSYAHTVKATTPLWTALLSRLVDGERQSGGVVCALLVMVAGVCVASATELQWDALGLGAALAAAALLSLQHIYSKRVLRDSGVHPLRLLQALSLGALLLLWPAWWWADGAALWAGAPLEPRIAALLLLDGALAWLQAVFAFSVLWRVSPLAYAVASAAKRAAVVLASLLVLRNPASPLNLLGMALAATGVLGYNRAKLRQRQHQQRPMLPM